MRFALYGAMVGLAIGWIVHGWYTDASQVHAIQRQEQHTAKLNKQTATRTLAAATHVEAIHATADALHRQIAAVYPTGGPVHAQFAAPSCPDPFADPFRLLYDAGSAARPTGQAGDVLPPAPAHP